MRRRWAALLGLMIPAFAAGIGACGGWIAWSARGRLYTDTVWVPARETGLLLGTSECRADGSPNPYFACRIEAAAALYRAGKVRRLLLSGAKRPGGYDEPARMRAALLARGVPGKAMTVDGAGFRTLDSVVRAREVFGLTRFTVISQRFHNERALFIARHYGIDAIGFCARDVAPFSGGKIWRREVFARLRAVLDLWVFHTGPRFLGPKIPLA